MVLENVTKHVKKISFYVPEKKKGSVLGGSGWESSDEVMIDK